MSSLPSSARAENSSAAAGGNVDADGDEGEGMHGKGERKIGIVQLSECRGVRRRMGFQSQGMHCILLGVQPEPLGEIKCEQGLLQHSQRLNTLHSTELLPKASPVGAVVKK